MYQMYQMYQMYVIVYDRHRYLLFSFNEQTSDKVFGIVRNSIESFIVQVIIGSRYISERLGIVFTHKGR